MLSAYYLLLANVITSLLSNIIVFPAMYVPIIMQTTHFSSVHLVTLKTPIPYVKIRGDSSNPSPRKVDFATLSYVIIYKISTHKQYHLPTNSIIYPQTVSSTHKQYYLPTSINITYPTLNYNLPLMITYCFQPHYF